MTRDTTLCNIIEKLFFPAYRSAGRPQSSIGRNDIKPLLDLKVPLAVIATRLGISRSTLYNKIKRFGLELPKFSTATKEELAARIQSIKKNHPNCGEKIVHGHLRSHGLHVQRAKVRETIRQIDPEGVEARRRRALRRREYSVPCPLYLWHVDGNHKLIRYRIVIHVGVDGYSRTIVFIDANENNRSTTVERLFLEATGTYGYPIKVRTDLGGENVLVWRHMNSHWGTQRRSVIVGSSVHNQRVERLNRDLNVNIAQVFGPKLQELEELGLLDINNETEMFCLHYVLLPRVKKIVREFAHAHNNHSLRTEANLTPLQLLSLNSHLTQLHQSTITSDPDANGAESSSSLSVVDVPRTLCPLTDQEFYELQQQINPLLDIPLIEIYNNVLQFVGSKMIARQA